MPGGTRWEVDNNYGIYTIVSTIFIINSINYLYPIFFH